MKDKFGKKKLGENLKTLRDGKRYFGDKGYDIVRYYHDDNPNVVHKKSLKKEDKKSCEICGKSLVKITDQSKHGLTDQILVRLKKHHVFIDSKGGKHYTCFGVRTCLEYHTDKDYIENNVEEDFNEDYEAPDAINFFKEYIDLRKIDESFRKTLETYYDKYVAPFLEKWVHKDIGKENVLDFVYDLDLIDQKFTKLFIETEKDYKFFRTKIFRIIGVQYGQEQ